MPPGPKHRYLRKTADTHTKQASACTPNLARRRPTYRAVLALHAGAVEAQGGDSVADSLDLEDTLVASLARLGLGQVPGLQGDGLHLPRRDQDLLRADQLGTVLKGRRRRTGSEDQQPHTRETKLVLMSVAELDIE